MGHQFSRQGCADEIQLLSDGTFLQTEITSCGLNNGPLPAATSYLAQIACHLTGAKMEETGMLPVEFPGMPKVERPYDMPCITVEKDSQNIHNLRSYIYNMHPTSLASVKYLEFTGKEKNVRLLLRGKGVMQIQTAQKQVIAEIHVDNDNWCNCNGEIQLVMGVHEILFAVKVGCMDISEFEFLITDVHNGIC